MANHRSVYNVLAIAAVLLVLSAMTGTHARVITATVEAAWNETPLLQEGCEGVARSFGSNFFTRCLDDVWGLQQSGNAKPLNCREMTQKEQFEVLQAVLSNWLAKGIISESRKALFEMEMASRVYSPAVEAHYVLAADATAQEAAPSPSSSSSRCDGEAFAVVSGRSDAAMVVVRDVNELARVLKTAKKKGVSRATHTGPQEAPLQASLPQLDHLLRSSSSASTSGAGAADDTLFVIVYGLVGDAKTKQWVDALNAQASSLSIVASFRHLPVSRARACPAVEADDDTTRRLLHPQEATWETPLHVQGYGATLDLKNMEYKVVDEKHASGHHGAAEADDKDHTDAETTLRSALQGQTVGGVDLAKLKARYPELSVQLDAFAGEVEQTLGTAETKVNFDLLELQNLGLATVAFIADRDADDRLAALSDIASRFPFYASRLSKMASHPSRLDAIRRELHTLQTSLRSGVTAAVLDGEVLSTSELSLFGVLQLLHMKETQFDALRSVLLLRRGERVTGEWRSGVMAQVGAEAWASLLSSLVGGRFRGDSLQDALEQSSSSTARLSVRSDAVLWLNDVETDRRFANLPRQLKTMTEGDRYELPRRNVLNVVVVMDPTQIEGIVAAFEALEVLRQGVPLRVGVVIVDPASTEHFESHLDLGKVEVSGSSAASPFTASVAATLFHLCRRERLPTQVLGRYLSMVAQERRAAQQGATPEQDSSDTANHSRASVRFLQQAGKITLDDVLRDREFQQYFYTTQDAVRPFGLLRDGRSHVTLVNGRPMSDLASDLDAEAFAVARLVREHRLDDDTAEDVYDGILQAQGASTHYQRALEAPRARVPFHHPDAVAFLQDFPFVVSASYDGEVALVSQVLTLPCQNATLVELQTVAKAVDALVHCEPTSACHRTRLTIVSSCPYRLDKHGGAGLIPTQLGKLLHGVQSSREAERVGVLGDYLHAVLDATQALPRTMALTDANVAARITAAQWPSNVKKVLTATAATTTTQTSVYEPLRLGFLAAIQASMKDTDADDKDGDQEQTTTTVPERFSLLVNGRLIFLDESFVTDDFVAASMQQLPIARFALETLEDLSLSELAPSTANGFAAEELDADFYSGKTAALASFLATMGVNEGDVLQSRLGLDMATSNVAFAHTRTTGRPAHHQLLAVVDPTDRESQVLIAICQYLAQAPLAVNVTVYLNPPLEVRYPVRDVFTFVATPSLQFDSISGGVVAPRAVFRGMPAEQLLTLGIVEPQSWLVMPHRAQDDLDNIILAKLPPSRPVLSAAYRIHSLLVAGAAEFKAQGSPVAAAGLPLSLSPVSATMNKRPTNTLVMEKSGYYQLQAAAGVWQMAVQSGPMAAAFTIDTIVQQRAGGGGGDVVGSDDAGANAQQQASGPDGSPFVVVDSFVGDFTLVRVGVRPSNSSTANATVTSGPSKVAEIAASMANRFQTGWPPANDTGAHLTRPEIPTLNIFSVASGHLYERFLRMMMYSVFRSSSDVHGANTTRVKFWVIENYLSPRFKAYIPKLAAHYGFEVGFVTYQWPWWLPKQTEKQRKIWAYKILFLDVIFPLEVDRIIFVDADQTARADLHELYRMDVGSAPVAMTPFCVDNMNNATKGFRFWMDGFWPKHLHGNPYHISAIFLVDLQRFRAMRAGDTYRRTYASLAGDPNSLANLDQDLPNYLQDLVPIYSLPEEWLWCETWCSAESKARAKTIDLCNNPLTKMPKLDNAKMIVPGWEDTDNMLESLVGTLMGDGPDGRAAA